MPILSLVCSVCKLSVGAESNDEFSERLPFLCDVLLGKPVFSLHREAVVCYRALKNLCSIYALSPALAFKT